MSTRLWTDKGNVDITAESLKKDKWLATIFMNGGGFSQTELRYYPYELRRTYLAYWLSDDNPDGEPTTIYATDERNLLRYIDWKYKRRPDDLFQVITQYRPIKNL